MCVYAVPYNWLKVQLCTVMGCESKYCIIHVCFGLRIGLTTTDWRGRS
jgi:hypothetical protein